MNFEHYIFWFFEKYPKSTTTTTATKFNYSTLYSYVFQFHRRIYTSVTFIEYYFYYKDSHKVDKKKLQNVEGKKQNQCKMKKLEHFRLVFTLYTQYKNRIESFNSLSLSPFWSQHFALALTWFPFPCIEYVLVQWFEMKINGEMLKERWALSTFYVLNKMV